MSKDLRGRGFSFVGPTICYAFMQAAGMVDRSSDQGCLPRPLKHSLVAEFLGARMRPPFSCLRLVDG